MPSDLLEGRREVEDERVVVQVVQVVHLLERRDDHPVDRERGEDDEQRQQEPERDLLADLPAAVGGRVPCGVRRGGDRSHLSLSPAAAL